MGRASARQAGDLPVRHERREFGGKVPDCLLAFIWPIPAAGGSRCRMAAWGRSVIGPPGTTTACFCEHSRPAWPMAVQRPVYTGKYEVICPACGDDPNLNYDQVPPELQKLRGPHSALASGVAALDEHLSSMPRERARC